MLRASVQQTTGQSADLRSVVDDRIDPGLPWGIELRNVATAMVTGRRLDERRQALSREAGPQVAAAAVGVCANFEMMNRILDATGCPVPDSLRFVEELLGITRHR
jgi:hypothetical protein